MERGEEEEENCAVFVFRGAAKLSPFGHECIY